MSDFFRASESESASPISILLGGLKSCGVGILAALVLVFAASAASYAMPNPASAALPAALVALYLAGAVSGFAGTKFNRDTALLTGLAGGGLFLLFSLLLSFAFDASGAGPSFGASLLLRVLIIAAALLGALIGMKTNEGKRAHRRGHKRKRR